MFNPSIKDICNPCHDIDHNKQHRGTQWDVEWIKTKMLNFNVYRDSYSNTRLKNLDEISAGRQKIFENELRKTERLTFGIREEYRERISSCSPGCLDSFGLVYVLL